MTMRGARAPDSRRGIAFSRDSARRVKAATHLKRASVVASSSATRTSVGRISPRCTTCEQEGRRLLSHTI